MNIHNPERIRIRAITNGKMFKTDIKNVLNGVISE
jgi:hypothetical protein